MHEQRLSLSKTASNKFITQVSKKISLMCLTTSGSPFCRRVFPPQTGRKNRLTVCLSQILLFIEIGIVDVPADML